MHRMNRVKDARRRARRQEQKILQAYGATLTVTKVKPDRRAKLKAKAERRDERL